MMAFTLINQTDSAPSNMLHNSIHKAATVLQLFVAWNKSRKTHLILSNLNDRTLEDIGLTRHDVAQMQNR